MKFSTHTLGCKVNQYETQAVEAVLTARGHTAANPGESSDVCIINTCAVTGESGRKSRQAVRRAMKQNPGAIIAVCGCFSQLSPDEMEQLGADIVFGSGDRMEFADAVETAYKNRLRRRKIDRPEERRDFEQLPAGSISGRTRAMLKIEDGCQNFCTYCIIPYARGPIRSMSIENIEREARRLEGEGYREIVVTGIEISSYGKDLDGGITLIDAIRAVSLAAPQARIRLGSLEPRTITEEFAAEISGIPGICPHFHLSLQSGCDSTLARMKRRYNTADFYAAATLLRGAYDGCAITTDLITGFPGETEQEFLQTLAFIEKCEFSDMHIFPYSKRPGTPAATMADQVPESVKHERSQRAHEVSGAMTQRFLSSQVGRTLDVLFEREDGGVSSGHSGNYLEVSVNATNIRGCVLPVQITAVRNGSLLGDIALL